MRPAMTVAFLLLQALLLSATAQGIRLEGAPSGGVRGKLQEERKSVIAAGSPMRGTALCGEDGHCSGKSRKLLMEATATHKSKRSPGVDIEDSSPLRPTEEATANSPEKSVVSEHKQKVPKTYPDLLDIAGMDYSPAVRKPPIHN